jgi:formylglycine-generating enzyme required for sulfatase activity
VGNVTGKPIDLDTSAQYEYAARSGGKWLILASTYEKSDELVPDLNKFSDLMDAKSDGTSPDTDVVVPSGTYGPNYLGFEDMIGPVEEWVYDWYAPYTKGPLTNPRGPTTGTAKVVRTPNYDGRGTINRWKHKPDYTFGAFRCAVNSTQPWK